MEKPKLVNQFGTSTSPKKNEDLFGDLTFLDDDLLNLVNDGQPNRLDYNQLINEAVEQLAEVFNHVRATRRIPLTSVQNNILPLISKTFDNFNLSRMLIALQNKDDYTLRHSIAVGVLSVLIGKWLKMDDNDLQSILLAATLHDIGKALLPDEILNKPSNLTPNEFEIIKKHTIFGYQLIKDTVGTSHRQALVAIEHHERIDGSGYPFGIKEDKLSYFGKIVAVADVFHAMSSTRVYHVSLPVYRVLTELQDGRFGKFDVNIISIFIRNTMEFLIGEQVNLSNGQAGSIVYINPFDPLRPLIKINDDEFVDLSANSNINIIELID